MARQVEIRMYRSIPDCRWGFLVTADEGDLGALDAGASHAAMWDLWAALNNLVGCIGARGMTYKDARALLEVAQRNGLVIGDDVEVPARSGSSLRPFIVSSRVTDAKEGE